MVTVHKVVDDQGRINMNLNLNEKFHSTRLTGKFSIIFFSIFYCKLSTA